MSDDKRIKIGGRPIDSRLQAYIDVLESDVADFRAFKGRMSALVVKHERVYAMNSVFVADVLRVAADLGIDLDNKPPKEQQNEQGSLHNR